MLQQSYKEKSITEEAEMPFSSLAVASIEQNVMQLQDMMSFEREAQVILGNVKNC